MLSRSLRSSEHIQYADNVVSPLRGDRGGSNAHRELAGGRSGGSCCSSVFMFFMLHVMAGRSDDLPSL
jgi:hypothetical protein